MTAPTPPAAASSTHTARTRLPLVGLITGSTLSATGNVITMIALPLYVLDATGSAAMTGLFSAVTLAPVLIGGVFGGTLADRIGHRRFSIISDLVGAATIGAVPALHLLGILPLWVLAALVFATGLLDTPGQAARTALMPRTADAAGVSLERAMGWWGAAERSSRMLGAPLAGLLVAILGPLPVLFLDGATFLFSAAFVAFFLPPTLEAQEDHDGGYWQQLAQGFSFAWRNRLLRAIVGLLLVTNALDAAKHNVILPVYANQLLGGARALGLLVGVFGAASAAGALAYGAWGDRLPRRATFVVCFVVGSAPAYGIFAVEPGLGWCVVAMGLAGFASGGLNPILNTVILQATPPALRARVNGVIGAGCWAAMPLGAMIGGALIEQIGLQWTLAALGAVYLVITVQPAIWPVWAGVNRGRQDGPGSGVLGAGVDSRA